MSARHLIGKQRFDLRLSLPDEAAEAQHKVSRWCAERLPVALTELFDRLVPTDQLLRLDVVEVDLGVVSQQELSSEAITGKLVGLLEGAIGKQMARSPAGVILRPLAADHFELWLYFLEHGWFPAHAAQPDSPTEWHQRIFKTLVANAPAGQRLRQLLSARPVALERLIIQHEEEFLVKLLTVWTGHAQQGLAVAVRELGGLLARCLQTLSVLRQWLDHPRFWEMVFPGVAPADLPEVHAAIAALRSGGSGFPDAGQSPSSQREVEHSAAMLRPIEIRLWRLLLHEAIVRAHRTETSDLLERIFRHEDLRLVRRPLTATLAAHNPTWHRLPVAAPVPPTPTRRAVDAPVPTAPLRVPDASPRRSTEENLFYVQNAGVILLHGFLPRFFDKLELRADDFFKDEASQSLAVCLVHCLATGEPRAPEHQLVLPKLLCGMPLGKPLDHTFVVSTEAQAEGERLLQTVIQHWGALGESSPTALREGFLRRTGKLERRPSGWVLQVEHNTLDILLTRLPWGFGVVKLPWMQEMLRVEWQ